ncbi:GTPase IMAP family member 8-like [Centropristis striata]|uniref:GTPase IMAP family member 8-like n=1 Tax=Centropristis striata TaxID=184440 RepID=UPI0027E1CDBD|nr:GTPase IMAP family member 8-like [Centropristis striata]
MDVLNTWRIVLLGKSGVGKSSLANTIFGEAIFKINKLNDLDTHCSPAETKSVNGRSITLIDTPGFFDPGRSEEELKPEIVRCSTECAPGPHAFLIVLKVEKFTEHEKAVITQMCEYFSEDALKYAVIVFTHGDQLPEGMKMEEYVQQSEGLSDLVKKCGGRCHVVDNKYWKTDTEDDYRSNQFQVEELLNTIDKIVMENNGDYYTDEKLQEVEREIQKEEERIRRSSGNMSQEEVRKQAKSNVFKKQVDNAARPCLNKSNRRIVLLGKTGAGKSSLANTILGEDVFKISHAPTSETSLSCAETKSVNGRSITLIDTHSFFDTCGSKAMLKAEIVRCITECAPGPHAFLIVLKVEKFTEQEKDVVNKICQHFSEEALKYATVVFTHGDQLPEETTIEEFVGQNTDLSDLVKKCGGRCHVVDNKYWKHNGEDDYRSNQMQVAELLSTLDKLIETNKGSCYTNEMLQEVKMQIQTEEEHIRQSSGNLSREVIRNKAKLKVFNGLLIRLASTATGALLGALLGMAGMVAATVGNLKDLSEFSALASTASKGVASAALSGVVKGGKIGYDAAEGAESTGEAINKTVKAVWM